MSDVSLAARAWTLAGLASAAAIAGISGTSQPVERLPNSEHTVDHGILITPGAGRVRGARLGLPEPVPLDEALRGDREFTQKSRRKAWFRELHKTPDGVDWRAIERENGLRQVQKRNALAGMAAPPELGGTWVERGSDNQAGRSHAAGRTPDGALYVGSALGGVWKGTVDGEDWTPIGDDLYGGAHQLVVTPSDVWGEPPVVLAAATWGRVHVSTDDGETWEVPSGLPAVWRTHRLIQGGDGTIYFITNDGYDRVLSRSDDGGRTFEALLSLGDWDGDVWVPRTLDTTVYLVNNGELWVSDDRGDSWASVGVLPGAGSGARLVGSEAGAPRLYAPVTDDGSRWRLLRSDDAGETWTELTEMGDYWGALNASIVDPDIFMWGGVEVHRTGNGGASFSVVNSWGEYYGDPDRYLHADIMGINVYPDDDGGETWYINTDGGTYESTDGVRTVSNLSLDGLRISQYYDVLTSSANPAHIAAGSQDQGYQVTQGMEQDDSVLQFAQALSGDYGHLSSSDGSHALVYSTYPGFMLVQIGEDSPYLGSGDFPPGQRGWLPMVTADPVDPEVAYLTGAELYRYTRSSDVEWDYERWGDHSFSSDGYEYLSALVFAPTDPDRVYGATSYGRFFVSDDHGETWRESADTGPDSHYFYGTSIAVSPSNADIAYAGGNGYSEPGVYRTADGGETWEPWSEGLPDTLVYALTITLDGSETVFAGTETAAYRRGPDDAEWVDITGGDAPVTLYWSAETLVHENTVRFGTYGRGIWDYQMETPDCYPAVDTDLDGHDCNADCDDTDAGRAPGTVEVCGDGIDQDCDGVDNSCPDEEPADEAAPPAETPDDTKAGGCGCAAGTGSGGVFAAILALGAMGRRREDGE